MMFRAGIARVTLLTLVTCSVAPSAGAAQAASGEVPMDLVVALLGGQNRGLRVFVDELPPEVEGRVPVGDAERVVGGVLRSDGGTVVVEVPGSPAEALTAYGSYLESRGWEHRTMPRSPRGGFQSTSDFDWNAWCGESYSVATSSLSFDANTYLRIRYDSRDGRRTVCDVEPSGRFGVMSPMQFPDLEPPPDAVVRAGGSGSSSDHAEMQATVESRLTADLIFRHYARQLSAAGWVPEGETAAGEASIGRWHTNDEDGEPVVGVLAVWALGAPDTYMAWARMDRAGARR